MKTSLIILSLMASSMAAFSQGTVVFNNLGATRAPVLITPAHATAQLQGQPNVVTANSSPVGSTDYGAGAAGVSATGFTAELWAGADAASIVAVPGSQSPFRTGATAGYFTQVTTNVPNLAPGATGTLVVRAWDNVNGTITSWATVMANP